MVPLAIGARRGRFPRRGQAERRPAQGELIALPRAVVEHHRDDGQRMRDAIVQRERLDQVEAFDAPALGAEPAGRRQGVGIESDDRRGDDRPVEVDGYVPELIMTCLMNV